VALSNFGKAALSLEIRMADWKFYGRKEQLAELERILDRKRWFFAKVTGRRRIGKTSLIQRAIQEIKSNQPVFYVQVPDSEPTGVLSAVNDALETFQIPANRYPRPTDLLQLAKLLESMASRAFVRGATQRRCYFRRRFRPSFFWQGARLHVWHAASGDD